MSSSPLEQATRSSPILDIPVLPITPWPCYSPVLYTYQLSPSDQASKMGKYYCSYCDVFLTHDSQSVRKAHNSGRNHLANVRDYYAGLSHEKAQQIINQITSSYENMPRGGPSGLPLAHAQMRLGPGFMNPQLGPPMGMPMMGGMPPFQPPFPGQYGAPPPQFRPPFPPPPGMGAPPPMPNGAGSPAAFRPPGQPGMPPAPTFTPASGPPTGAQPGVHPDRIRMMGV